jgi:hypothetical protein
MSIVLYLHAKLILMRNDDELIHSQKNELSHEFEIKDMGFLHYCLGLEVWWDTDQLILT